MKKLTSVIFLLSSLCAIAQFDYHRAWSTYFGGYGFKFSNAAFDSDGNMVVLGIVNNVENGATQTYLNDATNGFTSAEIEQSTVATLGSCDFASSNYILKFLPNGNLLWSRYLYAGDCNINGYSDFTAGSKIKFDEQNNIYLSGYYINDLFNPAINQLYTVEPSINNMSVNYFEAKFTPSGSKIYAIPLYPSLSVFGDLIKDSTGGFYTVGKFRNGFTPYNGYDTATQSTIVLEHRDSSGNLLWSSFYGNAAQIDYYYSSLNYSTVDTADNLYLLGNISSCTSCNDNNSLNCYASPNCFQSQTTSSLNYPFTSSFISKFSPTGNRLWSTYFGLPENGGSTFISKIKAYNNFIYVVGSATLATGIATAGSYQSSKSGPSYTNTDPYTANIYSESRDGFIEKIRFRWK